MKHDPSAVSIERRGEFIQIAVGSATVRLSATEAEAMVHAIERAIDQTQQPKPQTRVH